MILGYIGETEKLKHNVKIKSSSPRCNPSIILFKDRWSLLFLKVGGYISHRWMNHRLDFISSLLQMGQVYVPKMGQPRL